MKETTCCFSGHRSIPFFETLEITLKIKKEIEKLIKDGYNRFICGGALGFDTICALSVLKAKKNHPEIKLILALPCEDQTEKWQQKDKDVYEKIKKESDQVIYLSKSYYKGCLLKRNRYMVDNSSCCIYFLNKDYGGTAYTVRYATEKGLKMKNIAL